VVRPSSSPTGTGGSVAELESPAASGRLPQSSRAPTSLSPTAGAATMSSFWPFWDTILVSLAIPSSSHVTADPVCWD